MTKPGLRPRSDMRVFYFPLPPMGAAPDLSPSVRVPEDLPAEAETLEKVEGVCLPMAVVTPEPVFLPAE